MGRGSQTTLAATMKCSGMNTNISRPLSIGLTQTTLMLNETVPNVEQKRAEEFVKLEKIVVAHHSFKMVKIEKLKKSIAEATMGLRAVNS